ncbi:transcriptional regulator [Pseudomonas sp. FW215-T2]|nr:transcriptional regulator [Pseudomonas sp. FW215-T2]PNA09595.1 transcriptional regulator [Pseudomonas sp. FW215-R3]PNB35978.1 transcriptional regulator [Pseudomonas sp. FW305-131]
MNYRHRDYFDSEALLYERLPVLSRAIAWLKRRLG